MFADMLMPNLFIIIKIIIKVQICAYLTLILKFKNKKMKKPFVKIKLIISFQYII